MSYILERELWYMTHGKQFHYLIQHGRRARESHHYFDLDLKLTTTENIIAYNNALCLSPQKFA